MAGKRPSKRDLAWLAWRDCGEDAVKLFLADNPTWEHKMHVQHYQTDVLTAWMTRNNVRFEFYFFFEDCFGYSALDCNGHTEPWRFFDEEMINRQFMPDWPIVATPRELEQTAYQVPAQFRNPLAMCNLIAEIINACLASGPFVLPKLIYSHRPPWAGIACSLAIICGGALILVWSIPTSIFWRIVSSIACLAIAAFLAGSWRMNYGLDIYEGRVVIIHKKRRTPYLPDELMIRWLNKPENSGKFLFSKDGTELYDLANDKQLLAEVRKQVAIDEPPK